MMGGDSTPEARQGREDVESLNDRLAREHPIDAYYSSSPLAIRFIEQRRLRIIRDMVGNDAGQRILEIGSGGGHVLRMFRRARLTAVDVSEEFLSTARRNLAGYDVAFLKGEIQKLELPAQSFDRIICTEVLEHTYEPELIIAEIARLLTPGGRAVITIPNDRLINGLKGAVQHSPLGWALRGRIQWGGDHFHIHQWRPDEFSALLSRTFDVDRRACAPYDWFPVRVCFQCRPRTTPGASPAAEARVRNGG